MKGSGHTPRAHIDKVNELVTCKEKWFMYFNGNKCLKTRCFFMFSLYKPM